MYAKQCASSLHQSWWLWELRIRGSDSLKLYWCQTKLRQHFVLSLHHTQIQQNWHKNLVEMITTGDTRSLFTDNHIFSNARKFRLQQFAVRGLWALWCFFCEFHLLDSDKVDKLNSPCVLCYSKLMRKDCKALDFKAPEKRVPEMHRRGRIFACSTRRDSQICE